MLTLMLISCFVFVFVFLLLFENLCCMDGNTDGWMDR